MTSRRQVRAREQVAAIIAAHTALTAEVVRATQVTAAYGYDAFAAHLDQHRAELNVVIGEFAIWAQSFGDWATVDATRAIYPAALEPLAQPSRGDARTELRQVRDALKFRRAIALSALANAREALREAEIPADHLTAYRRQIRLWAGEAVELVTEAHRLALADRYLRRLHQGTAVLREWMQELDEADREGELSLAAACGYGHLVERYRTEGPG